MCGVRMLHKPRAKRLVWVELAIPGTENGAKCPLNSQGIWHDQRWQSAVRWHLDDVFAFLTICYSLCIAYFNCVENILVVFNGGNFRNLTNSESRCSDIALLHRKVCERYFFLSCILFKAEE